jgi:hypothetical protein
MEDEHRTNATVRRKRTRAESWPSIIAKYTTRGTKQALIVEGIVWALLCVIGVYTTAKVGWPWWWSVSFVTLLSGINAMRVVLEGRSIETAAELHVPEQAQAPQQETIPTEAETG